MPNSEQVKQFLAHFIIPVAAAAATTWLFATVHVFNLFGISEGQVDGEIIQGLTFAVSYGLSWLTVHHILAGVYTPAAKAAARKSHVS